MSIRSNVDARAFDQQVRIDRKIEAREPGGGIIIEWQTIANDVWCRVDAAKANGEPYIENGIRTVADYTFWFRADIYSRLGLTILDRIFWNGAPYNISDAPNQQLRGRLIAVFAASGLSDGEPLAGESVDGEMDFRDSDNSGLSNIIFYI